MADQKADNIARILVEQVDGVPDQLLSDRGTNFLSELIKGVCDKHIRLSPANGWSSRKFNSTLVSMIAKCCDTKKRDWDDHLPYITFSMRIDARVHPGITVRDARIPTAHANV